MRLGNEPLGEVRLEPDHGGRVVAAYDMRFAEAHEKRRLVVQDERRTDAQHNERHVDDHGNHVSEALENPIATVHDRKVRLDAEDVAPHEDDLHEGFVEERIASAHAAA